MRTKRILVTGGAGFISSNVVRHLLAHTPLNLERNVSLEKVKAFKTRALAAVAEVGSALCTVTPLRLDQARGVVATATSMAGAMWQMAAPGTKLRAFDAMIWMKARGR